MGCACNKKGTRNTLSPRNTRTRLRAAAIKAGVVSQSSSNPQVQAQSKKVGAQQVQVQAQGVQEAQAPRQPRSASGLSAERRLVEQKRRAAIRRKLGKA
jgi:hypothetical protein